MFSFVDKLGGIIGIVDTIKENAKEAIDLLKSMGMEVIIVTWGIMKKPSTLL